MKLSENGLRLIQGEEGLQLTAYPDPRLPKVNGNWSPKQLWSIGYGHQIGQGPQWEGYTITRAAADAYFDQDRIAREAGVSLLVPNATPQQFDAMVSLAYNIGLGDLTRQHDGGFATSTVQRLHNAGDYAGAADAFRLWNKSAGAVDPVLVARRERERNIYLNGYPGHGYSQPVQSDAQPITWSVPASSPGSVGSVAPVAGLALAGVGLVFFCPSCSARLARVGVGVES